MKKYLAIFLFACLGVSGKLLANTITVSSIADLQNAINAAKPGDIIFLKKGVYNTTADILVDKAGTKSQPITIAAEDAGDVEITGSGGFNLVSPAAYVIIRGFTFTHAAGKARLSPGTSFCEWTHNVF